TLRNASVNVEAMLDNDIVGSPKAQDGHVDPFTIRLFAQGPPPTENASVARTRLIIGGENDSPARELARFTSEVAMNKATGMNVAIIYRLDRFLRGGDHRSFLEAGYPAIRFTEPNEDFRHQHQDVLVDNTTGVQYGDLPEFVDFEYTARVGAVNLATLWSLANAPGLPRGVSVNTTLLDNNTQLFWLPSVEPEVRGYEILWRPTNAPLWTHSIDVGMTDSFTVPLNKDNVIFGVRAVGVNGYKSPAVYPFPGT
ncbi:hypothetical protein LTS18_014508, partial [Coniosporium uncinatum]